MAHRSTQSDDSGDARKLGEALRADAGRSTPDCSSLDAVMADRISAHFREMSPGHCFVGRRLGYGVAIAAAVVMTTVSIWVIAPDRSTPPPRTTNPGVLAALPGDVDGSGRVDIIDAFTLARLIDAGEQDQSPQRDDLTGDGAVNRADVDAIARLAVRLTPTGARGL